MNPRRHILSGRLAAAGIFFLRLLVSVVAQTPSDLGDLKAFRLKLYEAALETKVEDQMEERAIKQAESSRRDYLFTEFSLNLDLRGSVYHPNLMKFRLQPNLGVSYQRVTLDPPGATTKTVRALQRYHVAASILKEKAYATNLFADRDITFRDFDFFNRARVDSLRYGGSSGYNAGKLPVTISYSRLVEDVGGGQFRDLHDEEDNLTVDTSHTRGSVGLTKFAYQFNQFRRSEAGAVTAAGSNHNASLVDYENWGKDRKRQMQSSLTYTRLEDLARADQTLALTENLAMEHAHHLTSNFNFASNHRRATVDYDENEGGASLSHQLYESLTSKLLFQGSRQSSHSTDSSLASKRSGVGLEENYSKRLGSWGRLSVVGNINFAQERRESSGQNILVADESHSLTDGLPIFLRQPNVLSVYSVTDVRGRLYQKELDYVLVQQGIQTEIRRVPGGLIANGSTVLISYAAATPPSGGFHTLARMLQVRLELFDQQFAVYGRLNFIENTGARFLVLQDVTDRVIGTELKWQWLQLGAEQEVFESNLSSFRSQRLSESFSFDWSTRTKLSLDLSQAWIRFYDSNRTRYNQSVIARCRTQLLPFLAYSIEGGVRRETGRDFNQQLATLRSTLDFDYGLLVVNVGYEFEKESYLTDRHQKHFLFMHAKRRF
jgi:hypothetical protein